MAILTNVKYSLATKSIILELKFNKSELQLTIDIPIRKDLTSDLDFNSANLNLETFQKRIELIGGDMRITSHGKEDITRISISCKSSS